MGGTVEVNEIDMAFTLLKGRSKIIASKYIFLIVMFYG